eukprot:1760586-Pleurochrysis_carterae.AAC.1
MAPQTTAMAVSSGQAVFEVRSLIGMPYDLSTVGCGKAHHTFITATTRKHHVPTPKKSVKVDQKDMPPLQIVVTTKN